VLAKHIPLRTPGSAPQRILKRPAVSTQGRRQVGRRTLQQHSSNSRHRWTVRFVCANNADQRPGQFLTGDFSALSDFHLLPEALQIKVSLGQRLEGWCQFGPPPALRFLRRRTVMKLLAHFCPLCTGCTEQNEATGMPSSRYAQRWDGYGSQKVQTRSRDHWIVSCRDAWATSVVRLLAKSVSLVLTLH
jgi:hypothetical protein